jgi:hypothetical protein
LALDWEDDEIKVIVPDGVRRISRVSVQCPDDDVYISIRRRPGS